MKKKRIRGLSLILKSCDFHSAMRFWAYGEYRNRPLCFVDVGKPTPEHIVRILCRYDEWYGNTDQNTEDYALEFQLFTRMLICDSKLLLNPKYLDISEPDVVAWQDRMLVEIGTPVMQNGLTAFAAARFLGKEELYAIYKGSDSDLSCSTQAVSYLDQTGNLYFVRGGIGGVYKGFKRFAAPSAGRRETGIRSLQYREDRAQAQQELDAYARAHSLTPVHDPADAKEEESL